MAQQQGHLSSKRCYSLVRKMLTVAFKDHVFRSHLMARVETHTEYKCVLDLGRYSSKRTL